MNIGRTSRGLAVVVVGACLAVASLGGVAGAGEAGGSGDAEPLATLKVESPNVEVSKADSDAFKKDKDGQKLREGDTVRTDATGRAEVDYSDDAYTRLDVNTTFKLVRLTEDRGERQIEGGLDSGRTWNRTEAVTQSGSFEQSGAGAVAAVAGTAFAMTCTVDPASAQCRYQVILHDVILTGDDGQTQHMTPRTGCVATDGALCDELTHLTPEELAANAWIQENLLRDLLERGYGPGPFVVTGVLVVEDGQVVSFIESTPPAGAPGTPSGGGGGGTGQDPVIGVMPINILEVMQPSEEDVDAAVSVPGPASEIVIDDGGSVVFEIDVVASPSGEALFVVFTVLPSGLGHTCVGFNWPQNLCNGNNVEDGYSGDPIPLEDAVFRFTAGAGSLEGEEYYEFYLQNQSGTLKSETKIVPVTVVGTFDAATLAASEPVAAAAVPSPPESEPEPVAEPEPAPDATSPEAAPASEELEPVG
jgi:hypothetical protein